jgi:putative DNA primase/helicase
VGSTSFADSVITFLRPMNSSDNLESTIDSNQELMAFNNGILFDVKNNTYRDIEKSDFISKTMSIPFSEQLDAKATNAIYNIVSSFFEDPVITDYFLTVLGISLFTTKHEKLNILTGNGRNGKSLIMNYLNSILGDYATVAESDLLTSKIRNGVSCSLVNARNTRVILVSEPSSEDGKEVKLNNTLIKSITGNDRITARALYQNTISFDPTFNVFMLCNEIPSLEKVEKAMIERLNIIKFEFTFVGAEDVDKHPNNRLIDKDLKKTLKENLEMKQAFIQLLFKYAFANVNKELRPPIESIEAKEEYLEEIDDVKQFLEKFVIETGNAKDKINMKVLYEAFKTHSRSDMAYRDFSKSLERNGLTKTKSHGDYFIKNMKLKTQADDADFIED